MTAIDFSNEFDTLILSYGIKTNYGEDSILSFNEYEKSVFLTKALELLIISLYNGKNPYGESFEKTEEIRRYLSSLIETKNGSLKWKFGDPFPIIFGSSIENELIRNGSLTDKENNHFIFELPDSCMFIVYEQATLIDSKNSINGKIVGVVPTSLDSYFKTLQNPFRKSNSRRVLRLDINTHAVELISKYPIRTYTVKYIKFPTPIIVSKLRNNMTINGESKVSTSILPESLHRVILENAVLAALASRNLIINNKK